MRLEQAIFTSVRGERLEGYQLAATSDGIDGELAKELTAWGPAHDSLWSKEADATSINFHPLQCGPLAPRVDSSASNIGKPEFYCLSRTCLSGAEYSGRGGGRVYTQMLVVPREALAAFGHDPFLVHRAVAASGRLLIHDKVPRNLPTIPLLGRGGEISSQWTAEIVAQIGRELLAELSAALAAPGSVTLTTNLPVERLFQVLLHQLPSGERPAVSFTTGLRPSSRRPFKLAIVPDDPHLARQSQRLSGGRVIEVFSEALSLAGG